MEAPFQWVKTRIDYSDQWILDKTLTWSFLLSPKDTSSLLFQWRD